MLDIYAINLREFAKIAKRNLRKFAKIAVTRKIVV